MGLDHEIRHKNFRISKRKLLNLELTRRKRSEINDLINKELRIKNGAQNLLNVCHNEQTQERLKLELKFVDSNIKYLKDQLAELNCNLTLLKMKNSATNNKQIILNSNNKLTNLTNQKQCHHDYENDFRLKDSINNSITSSTTSSASSTNTNMSCAYSPNEKSLSPNYIHSNLPFSSSIMLTTASKQPIYLKQFDPLPEITVTTPTYENSSVPINEFIPLILQQQEQIQNLKSDISINNNNKHITKTLPAEASFKPISFDFENEIKSADIMIYMNLKETLNNLDFSNGFKSFIITHYRENPSNYNEQIRQFNYFRESTIRLSYEPGNDSIHRLFEYFNSLCLTEKRFFQYSHCSFVNFTWYDCINGVESTQKSIQFEKASILFNIAALYTQLASIFSDSPSGGIDVIDENDSKLEDQLIYWLKAVGCLKYLNGNFSNSPSLDMSSYLLNFFIEVFMCQAYEIKSKLYLNLNSNHINKCLSKNYDAKLLFVNYTNCSRIYSYISEKYSQISTKLANNTTIKSYLPEIWFYLIKVKSLYYKGLSHYYASMAFTTKEIENYSDNLEIQFLFDNLHDKSGLNDKHVPVSQNLFQSYFQKQFQENQQLYDFKILKSEKKSHLARAHMRSAIVWQEEAIRQHSFCRKFSKDDHLHYLLRHYHDISLDKFMKLEKDSSASFDVELFDLMPINAVLNEKLSLTPIEPNFSQYESKDFFNLIGPLKVYSSENELSIPFSCILRKQFNQSTFGITVKGDCPVRVNQVDPKSFAYNIGVREGDFIIAIQDQDVRWSKHVQVVEKIRSHTNTVKLTLINIRPIPKELTNLIDQQQTLGKKALGVQENTNQLQTEQNNFQHIWSNTLENNKNDPSSKNTISPTIRPNTPTTITPKSQKLRHRLFRLPQTSNGSISAASSLLLSENSNLISAANKLTNLAKASSPNIPLMSNSFRDIDKIDMITNISNKNSKNLTKSKNNFHFFKSTSNINESERINFNIEDDEINDKENVLFWHNLKSIKNNFTNTITLGRKFKKNVLKLSIFNSFSLNKNDANDNDKASKPDISNTMSISKDNKIELEAKSPNLISQSRKQTLSNTNPSTKPPINVSSSKNKQLKKQKRIKELEKTLCASPNQDNPIDNSLIYKTI